MNRDVVVIGGLPGSGKSVLSRRLAIELSAPLLASDVLGDAARKGAEAISTILSSGECFRIGYEVLFALIGEFLNLGSSVVVEMSMGWPFQWDRLDSIVESVGGARLVPVLLEAAPSTCVSRLQARHVKDPLRYVEPTEFMRQPQLEAVERLLASIDRSDVIRVSAEGNAGQVYDDSRRRLREVLGR